MPGTARNLPALCLYSSNVMRQVLKLHACFLIETAKAAEGVQSIVWAALDSYSCLDFLEMYVVGHSSKMSLKLEQGSNSLDYAPERVRPSRGLSSRAGLHSMLSVMRLRANHAA